jgi:hypothetical protein
MDPRCAVSQGLSAETFGPRCPTLARKLPLCGLTVQMPDNIFASGPKYSRNVRHPDCRNSHVKKRDS